MYLLQPQQCERSIAIECCCGTALACAPRRLCCGRCKPVVRTCNDIDRHYIRRRNFVQSIMAANLIVDCKLATVVVMLLFASSSAERAIIKRASSSVQAKLSVGSIITSWCEIDHLLYPIEATNARATPIVGALEEARLLVRAPNVQLLAVNCLHTCVDYGFFTECGTYTKHSQEFGRLQLYLHRTHTNF